MPNPPSPPKLKKLEFDGPKSIEEIEKIGRKIVCDTFALVDRCGDPIPFCKTKDGVWSYFRSISSKLITEDEDHEGRKISPSRIRRLHWIIPVITQKTLEVVRYNEFLGMNINSRCVPNWTYRIYFLPSQMYTVWLYYPPGKKSLNLTSAYRIDRDDTRRLFDRLFP